MNKWKNILKVFIIWAIMVFTATACFGRDETDNLVQEQTQEVIDVPRILPLSECVEIALKYNPFLQSAHLNKEVAAYDRKIVQGRQWPSLHAKGGANLFLDDQRLISSRYNGEEGVFGQDIEEIGVVLRMPLFTGGQIVNSIRAVALNQSAVDNQFSRSRQELIFNVTSAFYTILGRQKQLESIRFSRNVLNKNKNRINALISAKKAAQVDLLRIDVRLARIEQNWVNINNDLHIAWRVLYKLMGVQTDFEKELSNLDGKLMPIPLMPDTREAFNCALSNRPDFKALINKVDAQKSRLRATRGKRLPQIYLEGSYGYRYMTDPSDQPDGHDALEDRGAMGLALDIPIFKGGSIQAEINRETVMVSVLEQELRFLTLQIQKEVETAIFNMQSTWQRVKTQEAAIAQAREALRIEQEKYGLGKGTILDVLDAQNAMLEIETDYYRAASEYHIANAQFDLIKGEAK